MEKSGFFNSINKDRRYPAEEWANYLKVYFTNGVFNNGLGVIANDDMTITIREGHANLEGYRYTNTSNLTMGIEVADGILKRIDNVVIRLDLTKRLISAQIIKGTFSEDPSAPDLVRSSTIFDIKLAEIYIDRGITSITQSAITDTRPDTEVCGIVASTVTTLNLTEVYMQLYTKYNELIEQHNQDFNSWFTTTTESADSLFNNIDTQFNNWFNSSKETFDKDIADMDQQFKTWFANVKDTLGEDVAGALLNAINDTNTRIDNLNISDLNNDSDFVEDKNYVHTDNNFSDEEKKKITTNATNINTIVDGSAKSYTSKLSANNWVLNNSTHRYEYDVKRADMKKNHFVDLTMSVTDQEKWLSTVDLDSYDGGFKLSTSEKPEEDINISVTYFLTNMKLGGE